jgi:hypothetical protein
MGFPNTQCFVRPPDFFPAHACSRHWDCQRREGGFVSLQPYCRGQVHRTVPPTEMQIIVANRKDRNVDLPPPTFSFKFYRSDWPLQLKWKQLFWPFLRRGWKKGMTNILLYCFTIQINIYSCAYSFKRCSFVCCIVWKFNFWVFTFQSQNCHFCISPRNIDARHCIICIAAEQQHLNRDGNIGHISLKSFKIGLYVVDFKL